MVDYQACAAAAALDQPSSCQHPPSPAAAAAPPPPQAKSPVLSPLSNHHHGSSSGGAYQHSSSSSSSQEHISDQVVGEGGGGGSSYLDGGGVRSGGNNTEVSFGRRALKRSRLAAEDDDQLSIPPMDLSGANDFANPFFHPYPQQQQQQQLYHHQHLNSAVEATNNLATLPHSQQQQHHLQVTAEQNGHATASSPHGEASHFGGGDAPLMFDGSYNNNNNNNNVHHHHHHGGVLYPQMPGQSAVFHHGLNVSDVLAELERERQKNAELQGRVSSLEARLGSSSSDDRQGASVQNGAKKSKKQRRVEKTAGEANQPLTIKQEEGIVLQEPLAPEDSSQTGDRHDTAVTWMSREEVTPTELEKLGKELISDREDSGDSDDDEEDEEDEDELEDDEDGVGAAAKKKRNNDGVQQQAWNPAEMGLDAQRGGVLDLKEGGGKKPGASGAGTQAEDGFGKKNRRKRRKERTKGKQGAKALFTKSGFGPEIVAFRGPGIMSVFKKAPKTAFCPKEVKRIMESGVLALKNAQSHTMRKLIVFASLGIRHGCEDLYELDFSHFSVVRRGEPYKSSKDPGEHVLYDHLGVRTKLFYPNRQNPILCPVRILDEERAMRPLGPTCPTCLFLCIKYGGRTRNLPQNEYVRQRMGRNKLKSFGPLMCQMALLVHIRTGSFFFKALGITLLFMAGFSDDLVRKETKYRNLDLLQKYFRSDEDTKGEQLFHPYPTFFPPPTTVAPLLTQKTAVVPKGTGKKGPPPLLSKPPFTPAGHRYLPPLPTQSPSAMHFQGIPPPFPPFSLPMSQLPPTSAAAASGRLSPPRPPPPPPPAPPFGMYPPYPPPMPGGFMPMPWAPVNSYHPPGPYPPTPYAFQPFPSHSSQFLPPFYGPPYRFPPYGQQSSMKEEKKEAQESAESDSDSDSRSNGAGKQPSEKGNKELR